MILQAPSFSCVADLTQGVNIVCTIHNSLLIIYANALPFPWECHAFFLFYDVTQTHTSLVCNFNCSGNGGAPRPGGRAGPAAGATTHGGPIPT